MTKYEPLARYLLSRQLREVPMTFAEVEKVLGGPLPKSAYKHRPWWSNDATGHSHARAWLDAGFQTERVDMDARKVTFVSAGAEDRPSSARRWPPREGRNFPGYGALAGTVTIPPGVDLTEPADPDWGRLAYGDDEDA